MATAMIATASEIASRISKLQYCRALVGSETVTPAACTVRPARVEVKGFGMAGAEASSVRLDAGELDHFGPLLGIVRDEPPEVGGRARKY
jgi:hypothetical protein